MRKRPSKTHLNSTNNKRPLAACQGHVRTQAAGLPVAVTVEVAATRDADQSLEIATQIADGNHKLVSAANIASISTTSTTSSFSSYSSSSSTSTSTSTNKTGTSKLSVGNQTVTNHKGSDSSTPGTKYTSKPAAPLEKGLGQSREVTKTHRCTSCTTAAPAAAPPGIVSAKGSIAAPPAKLPGALPVVPGPVGASALSAATSNLAAVLMLVLALLAASKMTMYDVHAAGRSLRAPPPSSSTGGKATLLAPSIKPQVFDIHSMGPTANWLGMATVTSAAAAAELAAPSLPGGATSSQQTLQRSNPAPAASTGGTATLQPQVLQAASAALANVTLGILASNTTAAALPPGVAAFDDLSSASGAAAMTAGSAPTSVGEVMTQFGLLPGAEDAAVAAAAAAAANATSKYVNATSPLPAPPDMGVQAYGGADKYYVSAKLVGEYPPNTGSLLSGFRLKLMDMADMVSPKGYTLYKYEVVMPDGYIITNFRIARGSKADSKASLGPPVLLLHGISLSSSCWVVNDPQESLAFILADQGYDVWMINNRGNTFSRGHEWLPSGGIEYWKISYDDFALKDLPASVDHILDVTGYEKLALIGHSQGASIPLALLADQPEYGKKITVVMAVAPVVYPKYMQSPVLVSFCWQANTSVVYRYLPPQEFLFMSTVAQQMFLNGACQLAVNLPACVATTEAMFGPSQHITTIQYRRYWQAWPSSTSYWNVLQWAQMYNEPEPGFFKFNYGDEYNLLRVKTPIVLFQGGRDVLATNRDVSLTRKRLSDGGSLKGYHFMEDYSHMDWIWDTQAARKVYPLLLDSLKRYTMDAGQQFKSMSQSSPIGGASSSPYQAPNTPPPAPPPGSAQPSVPSPQSPLQPQEVKGITLMDDDDDDEPVRISLFVDGKPANLD